MKTDTLTRRNDALETLAFVAIAIAAMVVSLYSSPARAAGGDFSNVDFAASAPFTYDHATGGGAYDDGTIGKANDVVESLEGGDFACGDLVSYLFRFDVATSPVDANQTVEFLAAFLADTTGQSGAAHVDIDSVRVNYGPVQAGDGPGGRDAGIVDDGGSTATLIGEYFSPAAGPFVSSNNLYAKIRLNDLEAGETVIVRVDVRVGCKPYTRPTGNLQASLMDVKVVSPILDTINAGNQTIPFKQIGDLAGADEPALHLTKTVTTADGACPGVERIDVLAGDLVKYCYTIVNSGTADALNVGITDDNGTPSNTADDFVVGLAGLTDRDQDNQADDLASGATASGFKLVEADLRGGELLTNVATASGSYNRVTYTDQDTASVGVTEPPVTASIELTVTASFDAICGNADDMDPLTVYPGAQVTFCYTVTNTGGSSVDDITISDSLYGAPVVVFGSLDLAVGASGTLISGPVTISEDSADAATATGSASSGSVSSNEDSAVVLVDFSSLSLSVKASLDPICGNADDTDLATVLAGTTVYFCYSVVNTGETTLDGVSIDDGLVSGISLFSGSAALVPGGSASFISSPYTVTEDTLDTASAFGMDPWGFTVQSLPDDATVDAICPSLSIEKTVSLDGSCPGGEEVFVLEGQSVTWCYTVTNTGDTAIDNVILTDGGVQIALGTLQPGASTTTSTSAGVAGDTSTSATASGSDALLGSTVASDPDEASAIVVHPALAIQTTVSLDGTCPGSEVVNVLEGTPITWCYQVVNTGDVGVADIFVSDSAHGDIADAIGYLAPGESAFLSFAEPASSDLTSSALAAGTADLVDAPVQSSLDPASVNVVFPGLTIDVTVSLDGSCPGTDAAEVPAGATVTYCYTVTNLGDESLSDAQVSDSLLGIIGSTGPLDSGESITLVSGPVVVDGDLESTATASGSDIYGFPVTDTDTALVDALFADLAVVKSAPARLLTSQGRALTYGISVSNIGQAPAVDVVVSDPLPAGLAFVSASASQGSCAFASGVVTCGLGDLAPGDAASITIQATTSLGIGTLVNTASATSSSPDGNPSNNSSTVSTSVAPGATRTIGFYGTHPEFVSWCLAANAGSVDLGFTRLANESADDQIDRDRDRDIETGLELAMGILNANVSRFTDKSKRSPLEQARMQAGRQVFAAICNSSLLGGSPTFDLSGAATVLAGADINAILSLSAKADAFNNSGDAVSLGVPTGNGTPKYPWDDPTDAND